ncbi:MAG: hypothetical protein ACK5NT_09060 [Pyrinomonadaceae bacterium]
MKTSILLSAALFLLLFSISSYACACCAEAGYYKSNTKQITDEIRHELHRLKFSNASLYTTSDFPDNIYGIDPIAINYDLIGGYIKQSFNFQLIDIEGNEGTLELQTPATFTDYGADLHEKKTKKGEIEVYKEWRFEGALKHSSGSFENASNAAAKYKLILQGRGNACTSADDFTRWRLEVKGASSDFALYGTLTAATNNDVKKNFDMKKFALGELKGDYSGCGCAGFKRDNEGKIHYFFWSESKSAKRIETLIMNIDGIDTPLKLIKKDKRSEKEKIGDKYMDVYEANGIKAVIEYTITKLPCEGCEGTDYKITATVTNEHFGQVLDLDGSCCC